MYVCQTRLRLPGSDETVVFVGGKDIAQAASACGGIASMRATLRLLAA